MFNPVIRGWMNYYGRYYKSALYPALRYLDRRLAHRLGDGEIQTPEMASAACSSVGDESRVSRAYFVCALDGAASGDGLTVRAG
jgi:Group II intron, maturase-specific domain